MNLIDVRYKVAVSDFRKAAYYGLFLRYRRPFLIMFVAIAITLGYALLDFAGFGQPNYLVYFIGAAHLIWGLILFAGTEKNIKKYIKSPAHFLNVDFYVTVDENHLAVRVPARKVDVRFRTDRLYYVFELSSMFLIYTSPAEVYILPGSALTKEEKIALRQYLRARLNDKFRTRFS
ncbi:MAG: YcxB family protein [Bacillota bacterium]|nr:YcxB family protein [Bacillota bacterium]